MSVKRPPLPEMTLEELLPRARFAVVRYERVGVGLRKINVCGALQRNEKEARDVARRMNRRFSKPGKRAVSYGVVRIRRSDEVIQET